MSGHCDQAKTLKGDDVYDDLLEGLEAEDGHGAAVSSQHLDRFEDVEQEVRCGNGDDGFNGAARVGGHDGNSKGGAECSGRGGGGGMALSLDQLSPSSTLVELKQFIDAYSLPVKKNTGGVNSRTKADIYNDIVSVVNAIPSSQATPHSPMRNGQAMPRTVEKPRDCQAMHIPHSAASQASGIRPLQSHNSEISITVTADSKVAELKQFIDVHNLPVKKNTGGVNSRTKADIYNDIVSVVNAIPSSRATPHSPMPNGQATPRTVEKTRNRPAMHIPHSAASQASGIRPLQSHNSEISITVTADSKVAELKQFIDVHNLPVKKNTGGVNSRTKSDIYNDIVRAVHALRRGVALEQPGSPEIL